MIERHVSAASVGNTMIPTFLHRTGTAGHCMGSLVRSLAARRGVAGNAAAIAALPCAGQAIKLDGAGSLLPLDTKFASDGNARQWRN